MEPTQKSNKLISIIIGAVVIAVVAIIGFFGAKKPAVNTDKSTDKESTKDFDNDEDEGDDDDDIKGTQTAPAVTDPITTTYKDGVYTANGTYMSPGGPDSLDVTLTIKDGIVTASALKLYAGDDTSAKIMSMFEQNYTQYVVGQKLSTLNVGKVSKSSLTPIGFNDAVSKIRTQAKI